MDRVPPTALVLGAATSVQFGAALAKTLFDDVGAGGAVLLRVLFAALVVWAIWRPRLRGHTPGDLRLVAAYGASLAGMNLAFYEALDRIPLGVAVTFEFIGPLAVALIGSRGKLDLLWIGLAAAGILLLSDLGNFSGLDTTGVALALLAGAFWAAYILLAQRTGKVFPAGTGLALALAVSTLVLLPSGIDQGGSNLLQPDVLAIAFAVAMLSSAIPYSFELEALRGLPANVFGVLMSLEPAFGSAAGFLLLGQDLSARELVAIALVVVASAGASLGATAPPQTA